MASEGRGILNMVRFSTGIAMACKADASNCEYTEEQVWEAVKKRSNRELRTAYMEDVPELVEVYPVMEGVQVRRWEPEQEELIIDAVYRYEELAAWKRCAPKPEVVEYEYWREIESLQKIGRLKVEKKKYQNQNDF